MPNKSRRGRHEDRTKETVWFKKRRVSNRKKNAAAKKARKKNRG